MFHDWPFLDICNNAAILGVFPALSKVQLYWASIVCLYSLAFMGHLCSLVPLSVTMHHPAYSAHEYEPGVLTLKVSQLQPALVAELDAHPTGGQEVVGSTPAGSATFFRGDLIMKYFLQSFSPFR